jgi:hypothetical protein
MVARRSVLNLVSLAGAFALAALVGCSAAPEASGESESALPRGGLGVGGGSLGNKVVDPPPVCPPSNEFPYSPNITASNFCSVAAMSWLYSRPLDTTNGFEAQLLAHGCTNSASAVNGPAVPPGGVGWSWTECPDTCEVRGLIHAWHWSPPVSAITSDVRVTACSGTPAAGHIFAIWDPHCPSSCQPPTDI